MCRALATVFVLLSVGVLWSGQTQSTETPGGPILVKLFPPVYPALAKAARVVGDVELMLEVRRDGDLQFVKIVSGHPLLKQAALDSASRSQVECQRCEEPVTSYRIVLRHGRNVRKHSVTEMPLLVEVRLPLS
jgi:Gram-negative bacterial TonB protein C-terminal